jgi:hypothetical protein
MGQPVVHFEIIGKEPAKLRNYFGELFGWEFDTGFPVAEAVSEPAWGVARASVRVEPDFCHSGTAQAATATTTM